VAIDYHGDDPTIEHVLWACHMGELRAPHADRFVTGPVALDLEAIRVERAAAPAMVIFDRILKSLLS
jgi:hypothetical protein